MSQVRKIIKHRYPVQTEKSQPLGQQMMPETGRTSFPALSVYPGVGISNSALGTNVRFYLSLILTFVVRGRDIPTLSKLHPKDLVVNVC